MKYELSRNQINNSGILAGIVGSLVAYLLFYFISSTLRNTQNSILSGFISIMPVLMLILASSFMVYISGRFRNEKGSYLLTLSGSVIGFGICFLTNYLVTITKVFG